MNKHSKGKEVCGGGSFSCYQTQLLPNFPNIFLICSLPYYSHSLGPPLFFLGVYSQCVNTYLSDCSLNLSPTPSLGSTNHYCDSSSCHTHISKYLLLDQPAILSSLLVFLIILPRINFWYVNLIFPLPCLKVPFSLEKLWTRGPWPHLKMFCLTLEVFYFNLE